MNYSKRKLKINKEISSFLRRLHLKIGGNVVNQRRSEGFLTRSRRTILISILLCILTIGSFVSRPIYQKPKEKINGNRYFTIVFTVTYENNNSHGEPWQFTAEDAEIGLFMNNSWQTVYLLNASYPLKGLETDRDGNPIAFMSFSTPEIQPGETFTYEVAYKVVLKPRSLPEISENNSGSLNEIPQDLRRLYCSNTGSWLVKDPNLRRLAFEVAKNQTNVLAVLEAFITWIRQNIKYGTIDVPRYPNETLQEHTGDCDDQANLLITLCRIAGIPAYLQIGCIYIPTKHSSELYWDGLWMSNLTRIGWHAWAMVYVPPWGWLPVDLTYAGGDGTNPLNAINRAAVMVFPTVQYANVTVTDYVAAARIRRDFVVAKGYRLKTQDVMTADTSGKEDALGSEGLRIRLLVLFRFALRLSG